MYIEKNLTWPIPLSKVLHYNTVTSELTVDQLDEPVGCLALRRDGKGVCDNLPPD